MEIPDCYGKGIFEYWKTKKDVFRLLGQGIKEDDPIMSIIGGVLSAGIAAVDIDRLMNERADKVILPKEECKTCNVQTDCIRSAISFIARDIKESRS